MGAAGSYELSRRSPILSDSDYRPGLLCYTRLSAPPRAAPGVCRPGSGVSWKTKRPFRVGLVPAMAITLERHGHRLLIVQAGDAGLEITVGEHGAEVVYADEPPEDIDGERVRTSSIAKHRPSHMRQTTKWRPSLSP